MKIICIGRNYHEHIKELGNDLPSEPLFFIKPDTALLIKNRPFYIPDFSNEIHYETELVLKICKSGKCISEQFAADYYNEIGLGIDFTARDIQREHQQKGLPWEKSKAFDFSAAINKFIPKSELSLDNGIPFHLKLNGITVQNGNSNDMIFGFNKIISHISNFITLRMGDLIYTGTPMGVGKVNKGDVLEAYIKDIEMLKFRIK